MTGKISLPGPGLGSRLLPLRADNTALYHHLGYQDTASTSFNSIVISSHNQATSTQTFPYIHRGYSFGKRDLSPITINTINNTPTPSDEMQLPGRKYDSASTDKDYPKVKASEPPTSKQGSADKANKTKTDSGVGRITKPKSKKNCEKSKARQVKKESEAPEAPAALLEQKPTEAERHQFRRAKAKREAMKKASPPDLVDRVSIDCMALTPLALSATPQAHGAAQKEDEAPLSPVNEEDPGIFWAPRFLPASKYQQSNDHSSRRWADEAWCVMASTWNAKGTMRRCT